MSFNELSKIADIEEKLAKTAALVDALALSSSSTQTHSIELELASLRKLLVATQAQLDQLDIPTNEKILANVKSEVARQLRKSQTDFFEAIANPLTDVIASSEKNLERRITTSLAQTANESSKIRAAVSQNSETAFEFLKNHSYRFANSED